MRTNILGEPAKAIRPLSEVKYVFLSFLFFSFSIIYGVLITTTRAIENGANLLAEGFLFSVAAALILGESWRSSRSATKRRDAVDEKIDELVKGVEGLREEVEKFKELREKEKSRVRSMEGR